MNNNDVSIQYQGDAKHNIHDVTRIMPIHHIAKIVIIMARGKRPDHIQENFLSGSGNVEGQRQGWNGLSIGKG
jgi:hypothetical protein